MKNKKIFISFILALIGFASQSSGQATLKVEGCNTLKAELLNAKNWLAKNINSPQLLYSAPQQHQITYALDREVIKGVWETISTQQGLQEGVLFTIVEKGIYRATIIPDSKAPEAYFDYSTQQLSPHSLANLFVSDSIQFTPDSPCGLIRAALSKSLISSNSFIHLNPADKVIVFNKEVDRAMANGQLKIFDAMGRLVITRSTILDSTMIPVSHLENGVYFVHYHEDNQPTVVERIIIAH